MDYVRRSCLRTFNRADFQLLFELLQTSPRYEIDESRFARHIEDHLVGHHKDDVRIDRGAILLFRVCRRLAVFPFESNTNEPLDMHVFLRAL
jgi:hypothetical protein